MYIHYMDIVSDPADMLCKGNIGALYVGSQRATTAEYLQSHNISVVISLVQTHIDIPDITHHYYNVHDDSSDLSRMQQVIAEVLPLIHRYRMSHHNVLVHCRMGVQRAPTVCAHYLHKYYGYSLETCYKKVIYRRPCAFYGGRYYTFGKLK